MVREEFIQHCRGGFLPFMGERQTLLTQCAPLARPFKRQHRVAPLQSSCWQYEVQLFKCRVVATKKHDQWLRIGAFPAPGNISPSGWYPGTVQ